MQREKKVENINILRMLETVAAMLMIHTCNLNEVGLPWNETEAMLQIIQTRKAAKYLLSYLNLHFTNYSYFVLVPNLNVKVSNI